MEKDRDREAFKAWCNSAPAGWVLDTPGRWMVWQAALAYARQEQKPVGWFNPWNEMHGYQQVAKEFEGRRGTIPLYAALLLPSPVTESSGCVTDKAEEPPARMAWADKRSLEWLRILQDDGPIEAPLGTPIAAMCEGAGWVERVDDRKFRITDAGRRALAEHEGNG